MRYKIVKANDTDALVIEKNGRYIFNMLSVSTSPNRPDSAVNKEYLDTVISETAWIPIGTIRMRSVVTSNNGFLRCNGALVNKMAYSGLYSIIGDSYSMVENIASGVPWHNQYSFNTAQNGGLYLWSLGNSLPNVVANAQAIVTKNRVYLIGGNSYGGVF